MRFMLDWVLLIAAAPVSEAGKASEGNLAQAIWQQGLASVISLLFALLSAVLTWLVVTRRAEREKHKLELDKAGLESQLKQKEKEVEIVRSLAAEYDKDLRIRRIEAYSRLWKELEPFSMYAPTGDLRYTDLVAIGQKLRAWYFGDGGLLLSEKAREHYFAVQDAIVQLLRTPPEQWMRTLRGQSEQFTQSQIDEQEEGQPGVWTPGAAPRRDFIELRRRTSALRTSLCEDAGTREAPLLMRRAPDVSKAAVAPRTSQPEPHPPAVSH